MQYNAQSTLLRSHTTLEWQQCSRLPVGMFDARAVVLDSKVYIGGGCTRNEDETDIYVYSPLTDTWEMFQGPI